MRPIADRFHAYTGSDMHLLVNFYMAYIFYLNFFLALSFCPFLQVLFPAVSCALSLALLQGFYIFWPFYSDFKRSSFFPFFRDAKSSRGCRYICAIFSAGANFWAILGHFWAILAILGQVGQFWVIFGLFGVILGHFWAIFWCYFFVAKYASVLFKSLFATLAQTSWDTEPDFNTLKEMDTEVETYKQCN